MTNIYAKIGEGMQYVCDQKYMPEDSLLMIDERPSVDHICQDDGDGTGTWIIDTTKLADDARINRNKLLLECDYTVLSDSQVSDQAAWVTYRQSLRDITDQVGFPETIEWPDRPE